MEKIQDLAEGQIGQRLADFLNTMVLTLIGAVAWFIGFATQDITKTVYVGLFGGVLTLLVVVPPWPIYNWNPVKFQRVASSVDAGDIVLMDTDDKKSQ